MKGLLDKGYRHRLYIITSSAILGLPVCIYSALLVLWHTNTLDGRLFSLSRLSLVSQIISAVSQAFSISSLALLTYFVQALAADRVIRRPQKLATIQDLLDAWRGLGSSVASIWRSRRLGRQTYLQPLIVFSFFAASSILQIVVPATITVQSTNSTIPVTLRITQRPELTEAVLSSLGSETYSTDLIPTLSFLTNALSLDVGVPPGVERGIWFNTLPSSRPETVTFTDLRARQPAARCASIPRRSGDRYEITYKSSKPGISELYVNATSLLALYDGGLATFSNVANDTASFSSGILTGYKFGGQKISKEDPPNSEFSDTVLYLPWSPFPDDGTRDFGNIVFVLISSRDDVLSSNNFGLEIPVNQTLNLTVWSWVGDATPSDTERHRSVQEHLSVTFHYWPIVCTMYLEDVSAHVRGDNILLSYSERFNVSQAANKRPFARPRPSSVYERSWGPLFDEIWGVDGTPWLSPSVGADIGPNWLERQVLQLLNETTSTQKIAALEAGLQSITSVAYSLLIQHFHISSNLTANAQGQQQMPMAKLHVNGMQTILGLLCVVILFLCVLHATEMWDGLMSRGERYIISGDLLDLICMMRGSSLPGLFAESKRDLPTADSRREKAERIDVMFNNLKLDVKDVEGPSTMSGSFILSAHDRGNSDALAATERALARLPYIELNGADTRYSVPTLTTSLFCVVLALTFLCCLHTVLIVLWARHSLDYRYFDLSKLGATAQAIVAISQTCTVGALSLLSYGLQRIAADRYRASTDTVELTEQTVKDLQNTLGSMFGIANAFSALWDGFVSSRPILIPVAQLCFFWLASSILHITTPALISVNTATVPTLVPVKLDTIPGNFTFRQDDYIHSKRLFKTISAVPYLWENRNASIRLPSGINQTTLFSTPSNISSSEFVVTDPYAHSLSVRCGVIPLEAGLDRFSVRYTEESAIASQVFGAPVLSIDASYRYTRPDGVTPNFTASVNIPAMPGSLQFGGEKPTYNSPPKMFLRNYLQHSYPDVGWNAATAERGSISFLYLSLQRDALSFPPGVDYASPIEVVRNLTIVSWVNDTKHPTTTWNGQPVRAFNESVRVTFFIWPLACVLAADQATATVLGNGSLVSLNSSTPSHTAFPFMTNEPKNQLESNWVPLLDMGYTSEDVSSLPAALIWETTAQSVLDEQPSITALEDFLAGFTSLTYSLLVQGWRSRYLADNATSPPVWVPQYPIGTGEHPKLKAHLQVNGLPLLVGSLGVLVLGTISVLCVVGHGITDGIVRDGGVIDLVSLLNNSALPEIVAGPEEYSGDQGVGGTTFMTRGARASRVMVAYGYGSLDIPRRIQQREIEHLDALSRGGQTIRGLSAHNPQSS